MNHQVDSKPWTPPETVERKFVLLFILNVYLLCLVFGGGGGCSHDNDNGDGKDELY